MIARETGDLRGTNRYFMNFVYVKLNPCLIFEFFDVFYQVKIFVFWRSTSSKF